MTTNYAPRNAAHPFVVVSSDIIKNPGLSSVETRIMSILLGLPQGWQPNAKHLSTHMSEGTAAIQRAISRLKQLGYLVCHSVRDAMGRFLRSDWEINEIPAPPTDKNIDARGNVVEFDRPLKAPKNLRREARLRAENEAKSNSTGVPKTVTATAFNPYPGNPDTGFGDRSNIDIHSIQLQDIEREAVSLNLGVENLEAQEENQKIECKLESEEETLADMGVSRSDKCSAPAEFAKSNVEVANCDETELRKFQTELEKYGRRAGRRNPPGWAFTIVKNLLKGLPCTYWEEFKAGVPIGTGDRREWESAPGVPCTAAKQCLEERFLGKPGTTPAEAALQVARALESPRQMEILWEAIKARVVFLREEARRMEKLGVQSSVIDPWMRPKPSISAGEAAAALVELHSRLSEELLSQSGQLAISGEEWVMPAPPIAADEMPSALPPEVLKSNRETSYPQSPKPLQSQEKSALTQIQTSRLPSAAVTPVENAVGECAIARSEQPDDEGGVIAAAKAKISAALSKFARPSKKRATLGANMAEVDVAVGFVPLVKPSNSGGLADYLCQVDVTEDDAW